MKLACTRHAYTEPNWIWAVSKMCMHFHLMYIFSLPQEGVHVALVGAKDDEVEGIFRWQNNKTLNYNKWMSGQPNERRGQQCLGIDGSKQFQDKQCDSEWNILCSDEGTLLSPINVLVTSYVRSQGYRKGPICFSALPRVNLWGFRDIGKIQSLPKFQRIQ